MSANIPLSSALFHVTRFGVFFFYVGATVVLYAIMFHAILRRNRPSEKEVIDNRQSFRFEWVWMGLSVALCVALLVLSLGLFGMG